jgi:cytochrome c oxidase subunit 3
MVSSSTTSENQTYTGIPTAKILLWIAIVSMIMLFAGLTSAYIVRQAEGNWVKFDLPIAFYASTFVILASSATLHWASRSAVKKRMAGLRTGLMMTLGLGLAFCFTQFLGWSELVQTKIFFTGNPSGSFLYVITGLHLVHLGGGIIYLIMVTARFLNGAYNMENKLPLQLLSTYWHFLDGLWLYLFVFLMLIR